MTILVKNTLIWYKSALTLLEELGKIIGAETYIKGGGTIMNIVVCDTDLKFITVLENEINSYCHKNDISVNIMKYTDAESFIKYFETHHCHLAFVDMQSECHHVEIIYLLHKMNPICKYILMSHHSKDVSIAYQLEALDYICKLESQKQISQSIEDAISRIIQQEQYIKYKKEKIMK